MTKSSGSEKREHAKATRLLIASGVVTAAGIAAWLAWPESQVDSPEPISLAPLSCTFEKDAQHSFDLALDVQSKVDSKRLMPTVSGAKPPPIQDQRVSMQAKLHMRVVDVGSMDSTLAFSLEPAPQSVAANMPAAELEQLKRPVFVKADRQCEFSSFGFDPNVGPGARNQLRGIMQSVQVVLAKDPVAKSWQHLENDLTGRYGANYARLDDQPLSVRKTKYGYVEIFPPVQVGKARQQGPTEKTSARVRNSDTLARWAADGSWVEELASTERVLLMAGNQIFADVSTKIVLKRLPQAEPQAASDLLSAAWVGSQEPPSARPDDDASEPPDHFKTMTIEEGLAQALASIEREPPDHAEAGHLLAMLMRAQPGLIEPLMQRVRSATMPASMYSAFFFGLEQAGTPEARSALMAALDDGKLQPDNRMRAAAALADIRDPDESTLEALDKLAAHGVKMNDKSSEQRLENAATFAIGALEFNMREKKPALAQKARTSIREHLRTAGKDPVEITAALDAIYNSGHPEFIQDLSEYFKSDKMLVRQHAYEALKHMPPAATAELFEPLLSQEGEAQQRALLAITYADQAREANIPPAEGVWNAAAQRLAKESSSVVRASYVHLIGGAAPTSPNAIAALAEQYRRESDPRMLKAIGRYVPADQLPK